MPPPHCENFAKVQSNAFYELDNVPVADDIALAVNSYVSIVLNFLIGFLVGSSVLALSVVKERYPADASGVATATVNTAGFVGATLLPIVMGIALDAYRTDDVVGGTVVYTEFGYRIAFAITAVTVAVAFLCSLWLLRRDRTRRGE